LSKSVNSAMSGSGKVISGLQSDLLQARTGLESTRGQLRLSQRAVDFLGRQNGAFALLSYISFHEELIADDCQRRGFEGNERTVKHGD